MPEPDGPHLEVTNPLTGQVYILPSWVTRDQATEAMIKTHEWSLQNPNNLGDPANTPRITPEEYNAELLQVMGGILYKIQRGDRPWQQQAGDWTRDLLEGLTFGHEAEIVAGGDALVPGGMNFEDRYAYEQEQQRLHELESPVGAQLAQVAGNVATGAGLYRAGLTPLSRARPTAGSVLPRAAAEGAIFGGITGAGEDGTIQERLRNAGAGAAGGAALGAAAGGIGGTLANRSIFARAPTSEALQEQTNAAYNSIDNMGVQLETASFDNTLRDITQRVTMAPDAAGAARGSVGFNPQNHPQAWGAWQTVLQLPPAPTYTQVEQARRLLSATGRGGSSITPDDARVARVLRDELDRYLARITPNDVMAGDPEAALSAVQLGRGLHLQRMRGDIIQDAFDNAGDAATSWQGARGQQMALVNELRRIRRDDELMAVFRPEEQELIKKAATGYASERLLRRVGQIGLSNPLMAAGVIAGTATAGRPGAGLTAVAAGEAAGHLASGMTGQNARLISALGRSGGQATPAPAILPTTQAAVAGGAPQLTANPTMQQYLDTIFPPPAPNIRRAYQSFTGTQ